MFLGSLLVIPDNFSFHHHDEISLQNFSNTESRTNARTHKGKPVYRGGTGPPKNYNKVLIKHGLKDIYKFFQDMLLNLDAFVKKKNSYLPLD